MGRKTSTIDWRVTFRVEDGQNFVVEMIDDGSRPAKVPSSAGR